MEKFQDNEPIPESIGDSVEIWRRIPYETIYYEVSDLGRVRTLSTQRILRARVGKKGAPTVSLSYRHFGEPKATMRSVPKLVAETFSDLLPNPRNLPCLAYRDGDEKNSAVSNLYWKDYDVGSFSRIGGNRPKKKRSAREEGLIQGQQALMNTMSYEEQQEMVRTMGMPIDGVVLKTKPISQPQPIKRLAPKTYNCDLYIDIIDFPEPTEEFHDDGRE